LKQFHKYETLIDKIIILGPKYMILILGLLCNFSFLLHKLVNMPLW